MITSPSIMKQHPRALPAIITLSTILAGWFVYLYLGGKCSMEANLLPLFAYFTAQLKSINAQVWIDYGTLLGGIRENKLLAHEFDLDFAATEEECPRVIQLLKEKVKLDGYHAYERGEWIEQKHNRILGHDGYLHKPCFRIYDQKHEIYVDIDWYRSYSPAQVAATQAVLEGRLPKLEVAAPADQKPTVPTRSLHSTATPSGPEEAPLPKRLGGLDIPVEWTQESGKSLLCNEEGIDGGDAGGCRIHEWVLPLKPFTFANGIETLIPNQPEKNLASMYGDDWMTPRGKGYKILVCSWFPNAGLAIFALVLFTLITPSILYLSIAHVYSNGLTLRRPLSLKSLQEYQLLKQKGLSDLELLELQLGAVPEETQTVLEHVR